MIVDVRLVQTRIPEKAFDEATRMAAEAGVSLAAWLRGLVLQATGVNGLGVKVAEE